MQGRRSRLVHPLKEEEEDLIAITQPPTAGKMQKQRKPVGAAECPAGGQASPPARDASETERDSTTASELGMYFKLTHLCTKLRLECSHMYNLRGTFWPRLAATFCANSSEPSAQELVSVPVQNRLGFYFSWLAGRPEVDINFHYMCQLLDEGADINETCGIALNMTYILYYTYLG